MEKGDAPAEAVAAQQQQADPLEPALPTPDHLLQLQTTGQLPPVAASSPSSEGTPEHSPVVSVGGPNDAQKLDEVEITRRAMVNTMRMFDASEFKQDPALFKQTVLETLEIVRAQHRAQGVVLAPDHEARPLQPIGDKLPEPVLPGLNLTMTLSPVRQKVPLQEGTAKLDAGAGAIAIAKQKEEEEELEAELRLTDQRKTCRGKVFLPIIESTVFEWIVLSAIVLNCVQLCEYFQLHPYTDEMPSWLRTVDDVVEVSLWVVFSAEFVLKMLALGPCLYFADNWNTLDAVILAFGFVGFLPGVGSLTVLRVMRIVRPMRIVGKMRGMKVIMETIQLSLKPLFDTVLLSFLLFFVFGIVGLMLFQGVLNRRCYNVAEDGSYELDEHTERLCGGEFSCGDNQNCVISDESPNYSLTSFNNIGTCFLTIFVAITLEGWTDVMYFTQDSYSWWPATIYFLLLIVFGSLFTLNLALAIISDAYSEMEGEGEQEDEEEDEPPSLEFADSMLTPRIALVAQPEVPLPGAGNACYRCEQVARSDFLSYSITFFILANTVVLAMDYKDTCNINGINQACDMPDTLADVLINLNYLFIAVFTFEALVKLSGLGWREYFGDSWNVFDLIIVVFSYVELAFDGSSSLSSLRTLRLARVMKLAKNWDSLRDLLQTIMDTLPSVGYLSILLTLFMFVAAISGMALFGNKFQPPYIDGTTRSNFDNFFKAMLTVFQIMTGENWNEVLYNGMKASSPETQWLTAVFFVAMYSVGNFLLLNLFLAILLSNFGEGEPPDFSLDAIQEFVSDLIFGKKPEESASVAPAGPEDEEEAAAGTKLNHSCATVIALNRLQKIKFEVGSRTGSSLYDTTLYDTSLFIFRPANSVRIFCYHVVVHKVFENTIFLFILLSSVALALDGPTLEDGSTLKTVLDWADWVFVVVFFLEMCLKLVVYGFAFSKNAYIKNGWNMLDFIIVLSSITALFVSDGVSVLRVLRALRSLRPLRMITRAPGLKCVVDAIFGCMPAFFNISLVTCLVYLVFSIMAVGLWAGKFWKCNDTSVDRVEQCVDDYDVDGVMTAREWTNSRQNFDNVWNGLLTLFEVASLEIWLDVMYDAMDSPTELGDQPQTNQSAISALYFVVFITIGAFLMLNLFVGAVVDNFNKVKSEMHRSAILTEEQDAFVKSLRTLINNKPQTKPVAPQGERGSVQGGSCYFKLRTMCFKVTQYSWKKWEPATLHAAPSFDLLIMMLIVVNIIIMSLYVWEQPTFPMLANDTVATYEYQEERTLNYLLEFGNTAFVFIFAFEGIMKLLALGMEQYFQYGMNIFDFGVVVVSLVGFVIDLVLTDVDATLIQVIMVVRALRVVRIMRLITRVKGIRRLLLTLLYSLPGLGNVSVLLFIILFIYTVLGMSFFGGMEYNQGSYQMYNEHANFRYFHTGFVTLFRMSTGESWNGIMHDCMEEYPSAWVFYVSYMIIGSYLMFNLLIAILLEEFSVAQQQESHVVTPDQVEAYSLLWRDLDPKATHFISCDMLPSILKKLDKPLGAGSKASAHELMKFMGSLNLKVSGGNAHFVETFISLVSHAYNVEELNPQLYNQIVKDLVDTFPSLSEVDPKQEKDAIQTFAAIKLQSIVRGFRGRVKTHARRRSSVQQGAAMAAAAHVTSKIKPELPAELRPNAPPPS